jgi:hydrogenase maturation protein HypF
MTDLAQGIARSLIAARFHCGLASAINDMTMQLVRLHGVSTIALSGGVWQNRALFELVMAKFQANGLNLLSHQEVPTNDGGLSLGQAVIAAARSIKAAGTC